MADITERIFCAALTGITANPSFFGPSYQANPLLAVEFARECVRLAFNDDPQRAAPNLTFPMCGLKNDGDLAWKSGEGA